MSGIADRNFDRFSIAYGLSIPSYESPDFQLPSQQTPTPPQSYPINPNRSNEDWGENPTDFNG
jgi:hypothetical protein